MSDDRPVVTLLEAGTAAERLGVSPSGLRRLSLIYEEVYESLPRKAKSNNRLWPEEAIGRLQTARALLQAERYRTIQEALEALKHGLVDEEDLEAHPKPLDSSQRGLEVLIGELRELREELAATREQNLALQSHLSKNLVSSPETDEALIVRLARRIDALLKRVFR